VGQYYNWTIDELLYALPPGLTPAEVIDYSMEQAPRPIYFTRPHKLSVE
jgi:hypothetical protein